MVKPPPVEVVACSQVFRVCGFLCSLVSGYDSFVLFLSVSIVLDSHDSSVAVSFRFEVLSPAPGGACQNCRTICCILYSPVSYMWLRLVCNSPVLACHV